MAGLVLGSHGENTSKLSSADRGSTKPNVCGAIQVLIRKYQWTESYGRLLERACNWKNGLFNLYSPGDLTKHEILMFRKISSGKMSSSQNVVISIVSVLEDSPEIMSA